MGAIAASSSAGGNAVKLRAVVVGRTVSPMSKSVGAKCDLENFRFPEQHANGTKILIDSQAISYLKPL